jgi:phospholipase C
MSVLLSSAVSLTAAHEIQNVVVMMLENRAFDHMLGYMARGGPFGDVRVDGLANGTDYCNLRDLLDPSQGKICVSDAGKDKVPYDPNHGFAATTERIFGCKWEHTEGTPCNNMTSTTGINDMSGFVQSAIFNGKDGNNEMEAWPPEKVPVITTLAKEFALFDRFFASHPGSTYPNRQFVLSGTAHGMTDTGNQVPKGGFPQKTVLRSFEESGLDWRMYYEDSLAWAIFMKDVQRPEAQPFILKMNQFYADAKSGSLANFTFLEPRISASSAAKDDPTYGLANHQHPQASVKEGERWMKNVYEALRASPQWNNTLLLVTYDEHGGFYDHVGPPQTGVPNPDGICTKEGFPYTRLGIRVPTIAISPWIQKGQLVHDAPAAQKPSPSSEYELSSIPATLRKLFPQVRVTQCMDFPPPCAKLSPHVAPLHRCQQCIPINHKLTHSLTH